MYLVHPLYGPRRFSYPDQETAEELLDETLDTVTNLQWYARQLEDLIFTHTQFTGDELNAIRKECSIKSSDLYDPSDDDSPW